MKRGDVCIAPIENFDGSPPKNRPVVIVQADFYNQRIRNILVAHVTSTLARRSDPAHLLIDVSTVDGAGSGLQMNSLVSCINVSVMPHSRVLRKIGVLSDDLIKKLDDCLRAAFGI